MRLGMSHVQTAQKISQDKNAFNLHLYVYMNQDRWVYIVLKRCFFKKHSWKAQPQLLCFKIWWQFVQQEPRYVPKCDFTGMWPWKVKVVCEGQDVFYQTYTIYS